MSLWSPSHRQVDRDLARTWRLVHLDMLLLERRAAQSKDRVHPPVLGGQNPTLRDLLLRAGAAWLIGWAFLLSALLWGAGR